LQSQCAYGGAWRTGADERGGELRRPAGRRHGGGLRRLLDGLHGGRGRTGSLRLHRRLHGGLRGLGGQAGGLLLQLRHELRSEEELRHLLRRGRPAGRAAGERVDDALHARPHGPETVLPLLGGPAEVELRVPGLPFRGAALEVRLELRGAAPGLVAVQERAELLAFLLAADHGWGGALVVPDQEGAAAVRGGLHRAATLGVRLREGEEPGLRQGPEEGGGHLAAGATGDGDAAERAGGVHAELPGGGPTDYVRVAGGPAEGLRLERLAVFVGVGDGGLRGRGLLGGRGRGGRGGRRLHGRGGGRLCGGGGLADALARTVRDVHQDGVVAHVPDGNLEREPGLVRPLLDVVRAVHDHGRGLVAVDANVREQALAVTVSALDLEALPLALLQAGALESAGDGDGGGGGGGDENHVELLRCGVLHAQLGLVTLQSQAA
jgi:hypothetical protein